MTALIAGYLEVCLDFPGDLPDIPEIGPAVKHLHRDALKLRGK